MEVWHNRGAGNFWLGLELTGYEGATTLGTQIAVFRRDGGQILRQVYAPADGSDFPARLRIGFGRLTQYDMVTLYWSSGMVTRVERPTLNRYLHLEGPGRTPPPRAIAAAPDP